MLWEEIICVTHFKKLARTHGTRYKTTEKQNKKERSWKKMPILWSISKEFVFVVKFQGNVNNAEWLWENILVWHPWFLYMIKNWCVKHKISKYNYVQIRYMLNRWEIEIGNVRPIILTIFIWPRYRASPVGFCDNISQAFHVISVFCGAMHWRHLL